MTGISPVFGVGAFIPGSTFGGQITPFDWLSLSLSVPGELVALFAQAFGSAVWACAKAVEVIASKSVSAVKEFRLFLVMQG